MEKFICTNCGTKQPWNKPGSLHESHLGLHFCDKECNESYMDRDEEEGKCFFCDEPITDESRIVHDEKINQDFCGKRCKTRYDKLAMKEKKRKTLDPERKAELKATKSGMYAPTSYPVDEHTDELFIDYRQAMSNYKKQLDQERAGKKVKVSSQEWHNRAMLLIEKIKERDMKE